MEHKDSSASDREKKKNKKDSLRAQQWKCIQNEENEKKTKIIINDFQGIEKK